MKKKIKKNNNTHTYTEAHQQHQQKKLLIDRARFIILMGPRASIVAQHARQLKLIQLGSGCILYNNMYAFN